MRNHSVVNREFIYLPFVGRDELGRLIDVECPEVGGTHWQEATDRQAGENDSCDEDRHLFAYVSGHTSAFYHAQDEEREPLYRHFVFVGEPTNSAWTDGSPSLLKKLFDLMEGASKDKDALFCPNRVITRGGPILDDSSANDCGDEGGCDVGSSDKRTLCEWIFGKGAEGKIDRDCDRWRAEKQHRFSDVIHAQEAPVEGIRPQRGEDGEKRETFTFQIREAHCYWFRTGIGILAFELEFFDDNPYWISSGMFHLKKVQRERILPAKASSGELEKASESGKSDTTGGPSGISLCELGKLLLCDLLGADAGEGTKGQRPYVLYYMRPFNSGEQRGRDNPTRTNSFVYLAQPEEGASKGGKPEEGKQGKGKQGPYPFDPKLFYLANCFDIGVPYSWETDKGMLPRTIVTAPDITWSITPESVACVTTYTTGDGSDKQDDKQGGKQDEKNGPYVLNEFFDQARCQCQLLYVLALHQKFVYYRFLTSIHDVAPDDIEALEEQQKRLAEFKASYTYSRVTEVVQQQMLYQAFREVMGLEALAADVDDPMRRLVALERDRREQEDHRQTAVQEFLFGIIGAVGIGSVISDLITFWFSPDSTPLGWKVGGTLLMLVLIAIVLSRVKPNIFRGFMSKHTKGSKHGR